MALSLHAKGQGLIWGHLGKPALLSLEGFSLVNSELPKLKSGAKTDIVISKYNWLLPSISGRSSWKICHIMPWGLEDGEGGLRVKEGNMSGIDHRNKTDGSIRSSSS